MDSKEYKDAYCYKLTIFYKAAIIKFSSWILVGGCLYFLFAWMYIYVYVHFCFLIDNLYLQFANTLGINVCVTSHLH